MATVLRESSNDSRKLNRVYPKKDPIPIPKSTKPNISRDGSRKKFEKGMKIWVHDKYEVWTQAVVLDTMKDGRIIIKYNDDVENVVKSSTHYPLLCGQTDFENTCDLTELTPLHEASVLESLRVRYNKGIYYTQAGITLLAINPFTTVNHLYSQSKVKLYNSPLIKNKPPHVFAVAEKAYCDLRRQIGPINQSIIVSGESGAGKTWTARCLMRYLATVAVTADGFSPCSSVCRIEKRILNSNPILEAFGNAGTTRNANSSRFGKYIQLQFSSSNNIVGALIKTYLLEKTRVVHQGVKERNFHIFYQMLQGCTDEEREDWGIAGDHGDCFNYLPLDCYHQDGSSQGNTDKDNFQMTKSAMLGVGLSPQKLHQIFQLLCGILYLGNINFISDEDSTGPCEIDEDDEACVTAVEKASSLLGLQDDQMLQCVTFRRITASHSRRKSVFMKPCTQEECIVRRDCLAKLLYARLFSWLVEFINKNTSARQNGLKSFIGILDVYGFESFTDNSLEQLCINYANEKLQQHFVAHFLKAEQEEYKTEEIPWQYCNFTDNRPCLDVLEGKISVFSLMSEECRLNRTADTKAFNDRLHDTLTSTCISKPHISVTSPSFIIHHFADKVTYQAEGLIEKNKDCIPTELVELVRDSENQFICQLFHGFSLDSQDIAQSSGNKKGKQSAVTVVSKFKSSLDELMGVLHSTSPQYIRCIKPNLQCQPGVFDSGQVVNQLQACGVLETVNISKAGFPARLSYRDFVERYRIIVKSTNSGSQQRTRQDQNKSLKLADNSIRGTVAVVMETVFGACDKENMSVNAQYGKTKIFLREGQLDQLEARRVRILLQCSFTIQCAWRRYVKRKILACQIQAATTIQAAWRGHTVRKQVIRMHRAARIIQYAMLKYVIRRKQQERGLLDLEMSAIGEEESVIEMSTEISLSMASNSEDDTTYSIGQSTWESSTSANDNCTNSSAELSSFEYNTSASHKSMPMIIPNRYYAGSMIHRTSPIHLLGYLRHKNEGKMDWAESDEEEDELEGEEDDDDDDESINIQDGDRRETKPKTLKDVLKMPAVDIAIGATLLGLLVHGPLQF